MSFISHSLATKLTSPYDNFMYATLTNNPVDIGCIIGVSCTCQGVGVFLPLPAGWVLAPDTVVVQTLVAGHVWNTDYLILANGNAYFTDEVNSPTTQPVLSGYLVQSGSTYAPTSCTPSSEILIRKGA